MVVRPQPGAALTAAAARAAGFDVNVMPLFEVKPLDWAPPDPAQFDALLLTSANALRNGGAELAALRTLPVLAVGEATAAAARAAGFAVAMTGESGVMTLAADAAATFGRLLHLAGRDRVELPGVEAVAVYASEALPPPADAADRLRDAVVLLHSPRAARVVAALVAARDRTVVAAISPAALAAAGRGWRAAAAADRPTDAALIAAATTLVC